MRRLAGRVALRDDDGSAVMVVALGLVALLLLGIVALDAGALLRGIAAASGTADAAALAAAGARAPGDGSSPVAAAATVAIANGGAVRRCACRGTIMEVTVAVPIHSLVLRHLGILEATATARARLVPEPATRER